jgi:Cys-tRNA(Pro)/Cys-tRNA(Cys) deacylase
MSSAHDKGKGRDKDSKGKPHAKKQSKPEKQAPATPATTVLGNVGVPYALHSYKHDPDAGEYGIEAAQELGVDPKRVFKTLVAQVDGDLVVAVVPVSGMLDLKALAATVGGKKAAMADSADAERVTGYKVGGISPLGQRTALPVVIDASAMDFPSVLVSAGRRGLDLEITPENLINVLNARTSRIGR